MPTVFSNSNEYKIIVLSPEEMQRWPRAAVCDRCGCHHAPTGFYIAAYNLFYCCECYTAWSAAAQTKMAGLEAQERIYINRAIATIVRLNVSTCFFGKISNRAIATIIRRNVSTYFFGKLSN